MYTLPGRGYAEIPVLETHRLRLRPHKVSDFERMCSMWDDPAYYRFIGNRARPPAEVWSTLQRNIGSWSLFGLGFWTIADIESDIYMGECGFMLTRRAEITPPLPMVPEAGWGIRAEYWGDGLVKEAMRAAMNWALEQDLNFPCQCIIDLQNYASESVAFDIGLKLSGTIAYGTGLTNHYTRNYTAPERH